MPTANPPAISYAGQFSNQVLPIMAFGSALQALRKKMGLVRWTANKDFAGINSYLGAQVPIPYVGRIDTEAVTPASTLGNATALPNNSRFLILDTWRKSKDFAMTAQELNIFQLSSVHPRALDRAVQAVAEEIEKSAGALAYAFPAVSGSATSAFSANVNAIAALRGVMSKNLCPTSEDVALFLSSSDAWNLMATDDFKKNAQLAGLPRAEAQYGKAVLGEILRTVLFEKFITTRTAANYSGLTITANSATATASTSIEINVSGGNVAALKGDAFKVVATDAPEGYTYISLSANASLVANVPQVVTITQPLEFPVLATAAITALISAGSPLENLAISRDALAIGNRILRVGDLAESTGGAMDVADDGEEGTGLIFTLKRFPGVFQEQWNVSLFYGMTWADARLGGRLLSA